MVYGYLHVIIQVELHQFIPDATILRFILLMYLLNLEGLRVALMLKTFWLVLSKNC